MSSCTFIDSILAGFIKISMYCAQFRLFLYPGVSFQCRIFVQVVYTIPFPVIQRTGHFLSSTPRR